MFNVRMGRVIATPNNNRKFGELESYLSVKVEAENGSDEEYLIISHDMYFRRMAEVDQVHLAKVKFVDQEFYGLTNSRITDAMKAGRRYKVLLPDHRVSFLMKTFFYNSTTKEWYIRIVRIPRSKYDDGLNRAIRRPDLIVKTCLIMDIFD
jgi:hypothetical protein